MADKNIKKDDSNSSRVIIKILREIADELGLGFASYSYDWIVQLTLGERNMYIYGYQFPCNDAAGELICSDKAALAAVLAGNGIPAAEHIYFMSPSNLHYTGQNGNWSALTFLLNKYGKLVLKRNSGSGGSGVFAVTNQTELEKISSEIFRSSRALSVSPYYDIINEYRTIYCFGEPMLVYRKIRPSVTGDGKKRLYELILDKFGGFPDNTDESLDLSCIPQEGECVNINWKHNLGQGAVAEPLDKNSDIYRRVTEIAVSAAKCVNVNFASVDTIETPDGLMILEINSGIMMENFAVTGDDAYAMAKSIYTKAVKLYFGI